MKLDYKAALLEVLNQALVLYMGEYDEPPNDAMLDRWYFSSDCPELGKALIALHEEGLLPKI